MTEHPHWTVVVSALAIASVAVVGAFIAWNLWRTNRDILRERLFDRRYALFRETQDLIAIIGDKDGSSWDTANRFREIAQRARFMVAAEDAAYFERLRSKAMELAEIRAAIDGSRPARVTGTTDDERALCAWFDEQVEEVFSRMSAYLHFG